jgi:hypothetical protein
MERLVGINYNSQRSAVKIFEGRLFETLAYAIYRVKGHVKNMHT